MDKRNAPDAQTPRVRERGDRLDELLGDRHDELLGDGHDEQPTWRRTRPRANPEVHRADLERSTERLEMLLGH